MILRATARLLEFRELAPEVRHFLFEVEGGERFDFIPGQWVSLTEELEGRQVTRAYSIASPPDANRFELCLNRVQEGVFSPHLFSLAPGGTVELRGPYGTFVWRRPLADSALVATGTGIAPFRAMLKDALPHESAREITLLFGARFESGLLYRQEFAELAARHPNFRFLPTLTRPGEGWQGRTGRVQQHLKEALGSRRDLDVYLCGRSQMVDDMRVALRDLGFERQRVLYEKYD